VLSDGAPTDAAFAQTVRAALTQAHHDGLFSGAACVVSIDGRTRAEVYVGVQSTLDDDGRPLAPADRSPVTAETMFDLASVTKVFTAYTALTLVDEGVLGLDQPVGVALNPYASGQKAGVTLRQLLSHTAGLPPVWDGWRAPLAAYLKTAAPGTHSTGTPLTDRTTLLADLVTTPLVTSPASRFEYSCLGYNTVMALCETVTGVDWRRLVRSKTLDALHLADVSADPVASRCAATEYQPQLGRGVVRGVVHDETAWSLGGGAGNAGLFSTARDLLRFAETIRQGDNRITRSWIWDDALPQLLGWPPGEPGPGFGHSLGLRVGDPAFMGNRAQARGHTGFNGTSLLIERVTGLSLVLLTNRVHPSRQTEGIQALRLRIAELAGALADAPREPTRRSM